MPKFILPDRHARAAVAKPLRGREVAAASMRKQLAHLGLTPSAEPRASDRRPPRADTMANVSRRLIPREAGANAARASMARELVRAGLIPEQQG